jgi:hypothetical protein
MGELEGISEKMHDGFFVDLFVRWGGEGKMRCVLVLCACVCVGGGGGGWGSCDVRTRYKKPVRVMCAHGTRNRRVLASKGVGCTKPLLGVNHLSPC